MTSQTCSQETSKQMMKKGLWSPDEDEKLIKYINQHGCESWKDVAENAGLARCGKSCRLRWLNYLRPDVKRGTFSTEEEKIIIQLHALLGNRWSQIAQKLPGRTDNEIKNFWNSCLKKKVLELGAEHETQGTSSWPWNEYLHKEQEESTKLQLHENFMTTPPFINHGYNTEAPFKVPQSQSSAAGNYLPSTMGSASLRETQAAAQRTHALENYKSPYTPHQEMLLQHVMKIHKQIQASAKVHTPPPPASTLSVSPAITTEVGPQVVDDVGTVHNNNPPTDHSTINWHLGEEDYSDIFDLATILADDSLELYGHVEQHTDSNRP